MYQSNSTLRRSMPKLFAVCPSNCASNTQESLTNMRGYRRSAFLPRRTVFSHSHESAYRNMYIPVILFLRSCALLRPVSEFPGIVSFLADVTAGMVDGSALCISVISHKDHPRPPNTRVFLIILQRALVVERSSKWENRELDCQHAYPDESHW